MTILRDARFASANFAALCGERQVETSTSSAAWVAGPGRIYFLGSIRNLYLTSINRAPRVKNWASSAGSLLLNPSELIRHFGTTLQAVMSQHPRNTGGVPAESENEARVRCHILASVPRL